MESCSMEYRVVNIEFDTLTLPCLHGCGDTDEKRSKKGREVTSNSCKHKKRFLTNAGKHQNMMFDSLSGRVRQSGPGRITSQGQTAVSSGKFPSGIQGTTPITTWYWAAYAASPRGNTPYTSQDARSCHSVHRPNPRGRTAYSRPYGGPF